MLKFFKWLYIVGASILGIVVLAFLPEASNNLPLILGYFFVSIMCALNAVVFHKLDCMDDDVITIKKKLSQIDAELIAIKKSIRKLNEAQSQSDNTPPPPARNKVIHKKRQRKTSVFFVHATIFIFA